MATNAMKYYASYMQSHTERMQKFRDEAYNELVTLAKNDLAYKKLLQQREKTLVDAAARLKAAKPTGNAAIDYNLFSLELRANQQIIDASEDAAKRGIEIEKSLKNALTPSKQSNDKIAEMEQTLATTGAVSGSPDVVIAAINSGIDGIVGTVAPGGTQAAAAAQNTLKALESQTSYMQLSPAAKDEIKARLTTRFGLDTVDIAGVSGRQLLETPQDVLVDRELDKQLQEYGGAYGVARARKILGAIDAARTAAASGDAKKAADAIEDAKKQLISDIEGKLPDIQAQLAEIPEVDLSEANVRRLAREKYAPEAATFMKKQFEREAIGPDPDKLLHYDAIEAAKEGKIKLDAKAVTAAQQFISTYVPLDVSKAERRKAAIDAAVQFAGGDKKKRDEFLVAFHKIQMEGTDERTGPSNILPEPKLMGDIDKLTAASLSGVDMEARKQEVLRDATTRERISNKMLELTKEQMRLEQIPSAAQTPQDAERLRIIKETKDFLVGAYKDPKYNPAEFRPELADVSDTIAATAREPVVMPAPRQIGNLPSMSDLFANELEALLPRQTQKQR